MLIKHVKPSTFVQLKLLDVKRAHLSDFRSSLLNKKLKPATVNLIMGIVKTIFNEAFYREDIVINPAQGLGVSAEKRDEGGIFSPEEIGRMFFGDKIAIWKYEVAYACFFLTAFTGMRRGEVLALQWKHLHFADKYIDVERAWKGKTVIGKPKNGKIRYCGLAQPLIDFLENYRKTIKHNSEDDLVFCYADGTRLGDEWWTGRFSFARGKAGIDNKELTAHNLRHTLNTMLRERGLSNDKVHAWMGWSGTGIQERYTHWKPEHFQDLTTEVEKICAEIAGQVKVKVPSSSWQCGRLPRAKTSLFTSSNQIDRKLSNHSGH